MQTNHQLTCPVMATDLLHLSAALMSVEQPHRDDLAMEIVGRAMEAQECRVSRGRASQWGNGTIMSAAAAVVGYPFPVQHTLGDKDSLDATTSAIKALRVLADLNAGEVARESTTVAA